MNLLNGDGSVELEEGEEKIRRRRMFAKMKVGKEELGASEFCTRGKCHLDRGESKLQTKNASASRHGNATECETEGKVKYGRAARASIRATSSSSRQLISWRSLQSAHLAEWRE